jgi:hypothetical protein
VAKQGRRDQKNRKFAAQLEARHRPTERERRVRLWVLAGVVAVLVMGLAVTAVAVVAGFGTVSKGGPPAGTETFAETNHSHVLGTVIYDRLPPAGGAHNATPLNCGIYTQPVPNENAVHSLEHGAVWITYDSGLPADQVTALRQLVSSNYVGTEKYIVLSPFSGLPTQIVASAWGAQLKISDPSDSRLLAFIHYYAGGGQGGEPGAPCSGGVGSPIG